MALSPELRSLVSKSKSKYKGGGGNTVRPKEGRNHFRILAPTPAEADWVPASGQFWADLGVHWIKADENAKPVAVVGDCEVVYQRPSVINTAIGMAIESAMDEETKKLFSSWKARKSVLVNAVHRDDGDNVVVLELTPTTWGKFMELLTLYDDSGQDITDRASGVDIVITRSGKGLNTDYDIAVAPGVSKPVTPEQFSQVHNLNEFIETNFFRNEEQKALNAIASIAGIAVPALGGPNTGAAAAQVTAGTATPTSALTSAAASAAPVEEAPAQPAPAAQPEAQPAPAAQAEAPAAPAAEAPAAAPEAPADAGLSQSEEDALLAELDGLTA